MKHEIRSMKYKGKEINQFVPGIPYFVVCTGLLSKKTANATIVVVILSDSCDRY
jgi:hypothetical protein